MVYSEGQSRPLTETGVAKEDNKETTGVELKKRSNNMVGIGLVDIPRLKVYLDERGIRYEFYRYKSNPDIGLLVLLDRTVSQKEMFDALHEEAFRTTHGKPEGGFWSHSDVSDDTILEKVDGSNVEEMVTSKEGQEFKEGDNVKLTPDKVEQIKRDRLEAGFPHFEGTVEVVSGDMLSVNFGGSVRLIEKKDVIKI